MTLHVPPDELQRGSLFAGRFEILEKLGSGGMGAVYRVMDTKIHEEIALKFFRPGMVADPTPIERFKNELKLARRIIHKNVCRMFDLNEEAGLPYITMEYVRGEDLRSLLRRAGRLSVEKILSFARQVCDGRAEEALREADRAITLDPLFSLAPAFKGIALLGLGRAEEAREQLAKAVAMNPEQPMSYLFLGMAYLAKPAAPEKAIESLKKAADVGIPFGLGWLGLGYGVAGQRDEALKILARMEAMEKEPYMPFFKEVPQSFPGYSLVSEFPISPPLSGAVGENEYQGDGMMRTRPHSYCGNGSCHGASPSPSRKTPHPPHFARALGAWRRATHSLFFNWRY